MTDLNKKLRRRISKVHFLRKPLVIELEPPDLLRLKEKGCRRWYEFSLEALYQRAVRQAVNEERRKK